MSMREVGRLIHALDLIPSPSRWVTVNKNTPVHQFEALVSILDLFVVFRSLPRSLALSHSLTHSLFYSHETEFSVDDVSIVGGSAAVGLRPTIRRSP